VQAKMCLTNKFIKLYKSYFRQAKRDFVANIYHGIVFLIARSVHENRFDDKCIWVLSKSR